MKHHINIFKRVDINRKKSCIIMIHRKLLCFLKKGGEGDIKSRVILKSNTFFTNDKFYHCNKVGKRL